MGEGGWQGGGRWGQCGSRKPAGASVAPTRWGRRGFSRLRRSPRAPGVAGPDPWPAAWFLARSASVQRLVPCWLGFLAVFSLPTLPGLGHGGGLASVHDTVAGVLTRLQGVPRRAVIRQLAGREAHGLLTPEERRVLATGHIVFHVNQPVRVTVFHDQLPTNAVFWLRDGAWTNRTARLRAAGTEFTACERDFPAGEVGLGVNSLKGGGKHYLVAVAPLGDMPLVVDELYPGQLRATNLVVGVPAWADETNQVDVLPEGFAGRTLVQTLHARRDDAKLAGRLQWTRHPAGRRSDHVVLTWSGDPRTTQAIQWRTRRSVTRGAVLYTESTDPDLPPARWRRATAVSGELRTPSILNNPVVYRHVVELTGLKPGTTYRYRVGTGEPDRWQEERDFTTAPAGPKSFSFVYMGDAQNGLDTWGRMVRGAQRARPDVAFYLMAGDLVNRGNERDDWDEFFENSEAVFDRRPLVPVLGNHECQGGQPTLYLRQFALPRNGPPELDPERVYSFEYGNALFVVLDSNLAPEKQTAWLEERLAKSPARWKFVSFHHPAYSSAPNRDNKILREAWSPIFDRYGVDLALQGHDHAYLRTFPIRDGQRLDDPAKGTTYVVSVSGVKYYKQGSRPETLVGFTDVMTWQVLDLRIEGDRLTYRAYDARGEVRDEFVIDKSASR